MKNKTKKMLIIVSIIFLPILTYVIIDYKNIYVDMYNFWQLNKAKPYLESIDENTKDFSNLKKFNEIYNADIQPIKNCYYTSNSNWNEKYIFWFKLESYIYIYIYKKNYISFPKYSLPIGKFCGWWPCVDDINKDIFERITSNPCRE